MINVLVVDSRRSLADEMRLQIIVNGIDDEYEIDTVNPATPGETRTYANKKHYNFALVEHSSVDQACTPADFGNTPVYGYSIEKTAPVNFDKHAIPFMGYASSAMEVISIIEDCSANKIPEVKTAPAAEKETVAEEPPKAEKEPVEKEVPARTREDDIQAMLNGDDDTTEPVPRVSNREVPPQEKPVEPVRPVREKTVRPETLRGNAIMNAKKRKAEQEIDEMVDEYSKGKEEATRTIAVYSAKGGVGKTTIAANLALYLSMLPHNRGRYRVCLVDYNVESGDVRTVLGMTDNNLVDMGIWAENIHEMLDRGRAPEDIQFSRTQIAEYLEEDKRTGLNVLLAPELHENAQYIEQADVEIMLRNIIENGGFDFVICDTADNTSDPSFCAISYADLVLLLCTQDVTTANRNDSVLRSLKRGGVDLTKMRIVINSAMSAREAGVSIKEVKEYFQDYPCVGVIRKSENVQHANNYSKPLVIEKPKHQFTQDMQELVSYILDDAKAAKAPKKRGLIARILDK